MLFHLTENSRTLLRWTSIVILASLVVGCVSKEQWPVHRVYEGNVQPLEQVAILIVKDPMYLYQIDSYLFHALPVYPSLHWEGAAEFHLTPGQHEITTRYSSLEYPGAHTPYVRSSPLTINHEFRAGTVYTIWGMNMRGSWRLFINTWGPVGEVACSERLDPLKSAPKNILTEYEPPPHWIELRKTLCPEKVPEKGR